MADTKDAKQSPKKSLAVLCAGVFLMDFTSHIASQATPAYWIILTKGNMVEAAKFISYGTAGGALVEFLMNPWLGRLSDRFGRMLPLRLCPIINTIARGTPVVAGLRVGTLLFGRTLAGGARSAYYTAVKAAIADAIPEGDRTAALGQLGAFMQASFMVGMFSAGAVTKKFGPAVAFSISSCISILAFLLMSGFMKETMTTPKPFSVPNPFTFIDLFRSGSIYNKTTGGAARMMAVVVGLQKGTGEPGLTDAKNLYNRTVLGWDDAQRGIFLAFEGLGMTVANSLTGRAVKLLGAKQNFMIGSIFKVVQYTTMGLLKSGRMVYAMLPLAYPLEATASVESALTKIADKTDAGQGRMSADVQNLQAVLKIIFPLIYGRAFAYGLNTLDLPGLAHFIYSGSWVLSMLLYNTIDKKYVNL